MRTPRPFDSAFEVRVRSSFAKQGLMSTIGARVTHVAPGEVDVELPFRDDLSQQHGFLHAGVVAAIVDSACGYAALTLMPPDAAVLTSEYKINLLSPAAGDIIARGRVLKAGRMLIVTRGDAFALKDGEQKLVATMLATMMTVRERGLQD